MRNSPGSSGVALLNAAFFGDFLLISVFGALGGQLTSSDARFISVVPAFALCSLEKVTENPNQRYSKFELWRPDHDLAEKAGHSLTAPLIFNMAVICLPQFPGSLAPIARSDCAMTSLPALGVVCSLPIHSLLGHSGRMVKPVSRRGLGALLGGALRSRKTRPGKRLPRSRPHRRLRGQEGVRRNFITANSSLSIPASQGFFGRIVARTCGFDQGNKALCSLDRSPGGATSN